MIVIDACNIELDPAENNAAGMAALAGHGADAGIHFHLTADGERASAVFGHEFRNGFGPRHVPLVFTGGEQLLVGDDQLLMRDNGLLVGHLRLPPGLNLQLRLLRVQ
jgi:hypothetical protein